MPRWFAREENVAALAVSLLAACVLFFSSCRSPSPWEPDEPYTEFTPPPEYREMWDATRACVSLHTPTNGDRYENIRWFSVHAPSFWTGTKYALGAWTPNNRIHIAEGSLNTRWVIVHEMIHAMTHIYDHAEEPFGRCFNA